MNQTTMEAELAFSEEEMAVSETLGYPRAYAKLCRDRAVGPYSLGPPYTFTPYSLQQNEGMREMELDQLFPILNPKAKATGKAKHFVNLLWKQLSHLGNAGFDPEVIRVDPYGNVLYYHADPASPLAWDIDHWFSCSRGGLTVPSNLRIVQWQVRKRKHNKLEFLVPWWDLQLGITVNQFLSIFASSNSGFRQRGFSFLFSEGESEELNESQTVDSYTFPQHFMEVKDELGFAPAAIVVSRKASCDSHNRQLRPQSPVMAARKVRPTLLKENENLNLATNPYQALVIARDSLKQREESSKMHSEIHKLDSEVNELKEKNEEEKLTIQDLELALIKRRRRAEKCRRLAEAQSSYRTMLEKMIRDAMHQSVMYKEQVRLNQAASNALMARLEAQKAICDASERELHQKHKQRDDLEKQIRHDLGHARKRSRMEDTLFEDEESKPVLRLPGLRPRMQSHKELRVFLEEAHKASEAGLSPTEEQKQEELEAELQKSAKKSTNREKSDEHSKCIVALEDEIALERNLQRLQIEEIGESSKLDTRFPEEPEKEEEDEESRQQRGRGNVEKWLQMLLEKGPEELDSRTVDENETSRTDKILENLNAKYPQKEQQIIVGGNDDRKQKEEIAEVEAPDVSKAGNRVGIGSRKSCEGKGEDKNWKARPIARSESARILRRIPSSPSIILGMRKGIDFMRRKPIATSDDENVDENHSMGNRFIKSSMKTMKKVVKI